MDCPDCQASTERQHAGFHANCRGCQARMLSRSPWYFDSGRAGIITKAYGVALRAYGLSHEQVKEAAAADAMNRENA